MKGNSPKTILQLVLIDETGDSYYRMRWPGEVLAKQDNNLRVINLDARAEERLIWAREADLLVIFQSNDLDLVPIIRERRNLGKKTIVEYNDNFYSPPPSSPVRAAWSSPLLWQTYEILMREGDHVIVTGKGLKRLFSKRTGKDITILENHLIDIPDSFESLKKLKPDPKKELRIGWAGSVGHMADLIAVLPLLKDICLKFDHVKLCLMGNDSIPGLVNLPQEKFMFTQWGSMNEYYQFLSGIHIGVAPLSTSNYNLCRSDVKALEYASRGVLPIVQQILPYEGVIKNGLAKSFNNFEELGKIITAYCENNSSLKSDAEHSFGLVQKERNAISNKERLELYEKNLPESASSFDFGLSTGYHEIMGTTNPELRSKVITERAQEFLKSGNVQECLMLIKENESLVTFEPNLALLYLRCLLRTDVPLEQTRQLLFSFINRYPLDLRFRLLLLNLVKEVHEKVGTWENVLEVLDTSGSLYRKFFRGQVLSFFIRDIDSYPGLISIGERLTEIYPEHAGLLFKVSEVAEKAGANVLRARLLSKIRNMKEIIESSRPFLDELENDYLETLREAADYRSKM
ncbi:MAG TPA: hypothetical protein PKA63_07650 [Oligoflexia bacterium]|nr:hypothetical protein [Oligoflexia bacterium]HMP48523.1 hypothetical protein [Oligoflexia bacterium]